MITLIIVDCQNDFITGTMSIKSARSVIDEIKKFIKNRKEEIDKIVFTANWHPYNHSSFKQFGGELQHHCIQYTPGACIEPKLLKYVQSFNIKYEVSTRGELVEVDFPGAFNDIEFIQDNLSKRYYLDSIVSVNAETDFVVCGVYGDQSVKATISNLISGGIDPKVYMPGIVSTDGGKSISQFVKENKLEKIV